MKEGPVAKERSDQSCDGYQSLERQIRFSTGTNLNPRDMSGDIFGCHAGGGGVEARDATNVLQWV